MCRSHKSIGNKVRTELTQIETTNSAKVIPATDLLMKSMNAANAVLVSLNQFQLDIGLASVGKAFSSVQWAKDRPLICAICHDDAERTTIAEGRGAFLDFIEAMGNTDDKGCALVDPQIESLTSLLMNPSNRFSRKRPVNANRSRWLAAL
jgi:hypothetical protein